MRELLPVPMQDEMGGDVYSGIARASGLLWCGRERAVPGRTTDTVLLFCHPSSNFVGHYALAPTAALGVDAVGAVTRYAGNDTQVILENCVADLGSIIRHLREAEGYRRVVLVGNSGGGGLSAFYQSQAEKPTVIDAPGGGGTDLTKATLPPVDALVMPILVSEGDCTIYTLSGATLLESGGVRHVAVGRLTRAGASGGGVGAGVRRRPLRSGVPLYEL